MVLMLWNVEQNRHLARRRQAARQASRLWKLPLMQWKVEQNRHLARMAGLEAGLAAMEIGTDAMESGAKQTLG